ncbi:hypothetical protein PRIPAC_76723, partial [Pristionchus pacificus]
HQMLSRRLSHNLLKFWSRSVASTAEGPPQRIRGAAVKRPEFDFDYLLEPENLEKIRDEIKARKGVGDIDALHATWSEIQSIMGGERRVEEREYERLWDALYSEAARIPNRTYEGVPRGGEAQITTAPNGSVRPAQLHVHWPSRPPGARGAGVRVGARAGTRIQTSARVRPRAARHRRGVWNDARGNAVHAGPGPFHSAVRHGGDGHCGHAAWDDVPRRGTAPAIRRPLEMLPARDQ